MKKKFLFLLLVSLISVLPAVSCSNDEEAEGEGNVRCDNNEDCFGLGNDFYCNLDDPQTDAELGTLVYYCKQRKHCVSQADCPMHWVCMESRGLCITSKEAEQILCESNDDCKNPEYPICNPAKRECEPAGGGSGENENSGDSETSDDSDNTDSEDGDAETSDDSDAADGDNTDTADARVGENILTEDFESEDPNWTIVPASEDAAPCWEIGVPTTGPAKAYSGKKVAATVLDGDYPDNCSDILKYGESVNIPSDGMPEISFYAWVDLTGGGNSPYDYVEVLVKKDGEMWGSTSGLYLTADTPSSQTAALDNSRTKITKELGTAYYKFTGVLSAYKGQKVEIGFRFVSDVSDHKDGFYLDDIMLSY